MAAAAPGLPRFDICSDFLNRRAGILKALTTDVDEFFKQCDPEKEHLCLYGFPDKTWQVCPPTEDVPPELPEPTLGINFARDEMEKKDWLAMVAIHSDSWLLRVLLYQASFAGFNKESRNRLFDRINVPPTLHEVVTGKEEEKEEGEAKCGACGSDTDGESWILCFKCQFGFHGKCIQQYSCPMCSNKRCKA